MPPPMMDSGQFSCPTRSPYWLTDTASLLSDKVVCVDYSVAKKGALMAYRWEGETALHHSKFWGLSASAGEPFKNGTIAELESFLSCKMYERYWNLPVIFAEMLDTLKFLEGNYAISGELALSIQARHRFTGGIEIIVRDEIPKAWQDAIYQLGFSDSPYDCDSRGQDGDWVAGKDSYYVSVRIKQGLIADSAIGNSQFFTLFGKSIQVVTPTDLLWLYLDHGNPGLDIVGAIELMEYGVFDIQGLRSYLAEVQPELVKTLDEWILKADYERYSKLAGMDNWRMTSRFELAKKVLQPLREDWRAHWASVD